MAGFISSAHVDIGMVRRGKLDKPGPNSVAEHDLVSEVYHVISGSATLVLGPDIVNRQRRPASLRTVVEFNGPGNNGSDIRNGVAYQIKAGDVVVIPAGTGHWFLAALADVEQYKNPNATHGAVEMVEREFDNRISLIVDPPDGLIPPLTPAEQQRQAAARAAA